MGVFRRTIPKYFATELSYNLANEPQPFANKKDDGIESYSTLVRKVFYAVRELSLERPIVSDVVLVDDKKPMHEIADLDIIQSCRGYQPLPITYLDCD